MSENRKLYSDFLPRFRALIELGNWSQNTKTSMELVEATKNAYEEIHQNKSHPYHKAMRELHGKWWLQGEPGQVRVYRVTTQYKKPSTYKVTVSCDDDKGLQYFYRTTIVYDNNPDMKKVGYSVVRGAINMFEDD